MKLPAFQFYPGDWWKDPGIKMLTLEERGFWLQCLMLMHESEDRGTLAVNRLPMPEEGLAMVMGLDNQKVNQILSKLVAYGVASVNQETGVVYSRRMVRDEEVRKIRQQAGKKGGNPRLLNHEVNQTDNQTPKQKAPPSVSSSSSTSIEEPNPTAGRPKKARATAAEISAFLVEIGMPASDGIILFEKWEGTGWENGGSAIRDWKATIRAWKKQNYLPSQKQKKSGSIYGRPQQQPDFTDGF